ncbi:hypothetical protein ANCCAN_17173 [Ancylostoma caninum]|uniref:SCP domain-containing protein n=1 Tax=Ancylostoma caninum TaxID=29170 RepID=A0A368FXU1_ANCCA|nr:hypothetical protein ANCCAN_17173 [Ancylostoma caninum]
MDLKFPLVIKAFFVLFMVDLTVSGPPQPPACRNGTISEYTRRLIFFFFNLINNFNLPYDCDLEHRAYAEFHLPDTNHTRLFQRFTYQESRASRNTFLWKAFTSWTERIKKMTGLVDFGCHFSQMSSGSRIVCIILNQQFPPHQI